jgi:hypothetical protein
MFFIRAKTTDSDGNPQYWSNDFGWTSMIEADHFSQKERDTLNLPIDGEWVDFDTRFFAGVTAHVTEKGEGSAFRFCVTADLRSLCIQFADFRTENDFVDDSDIEAIREDEWKMLSDHEERLDEGHTAVLEYIKTTDEPYAAHGVNNAPDWASQYEDDGPLF